ncbi:MAG: hypothetical protein AB1597_06130 [Chloroflexota bacterium]
MPASWDFEAARLAGGTYDRPYFELFEWGRIEHLPGQYDFSETDKYVRRAQEYGMHILANIQPFASWDQTKCHSDLTATTGLGGGGPTMTRGKPCNMERYRTFVMRLVERYDGDGVDDMPGLRVPIKHWEMMNEPEFQTPPLVFFQGSSADYLETLKVTWEAVKKADTEAVVVQGGMAGMMEECVRFWQGVFDLGGGEYFDIANMHSIGHGEHLNIPAFKQFLSRNRLQDKPVWVTEVQFQQARETQVFSAEEFARILTRSYIFALANDVDKLFYVNIRLPPVRHGVPFDERSALIRDNGEKAPLFYAHQTVARLLGDFEAGDRAVILHEKVGPWHIEEGQYRFSVKGRTVYALFGSGVLPSELNGKVRVTDISGLSRIVEASSVRLTDSPIFVEQLS